MAAITATSLKFTVFGDKNIVTADSTIVADADTWVVPGMSSIDNVILMQKGGTTQGVRITWSGATITFADIAGGAAYTITVIGT